MADSGTGNRDYEEGAGVMNTKDTFWFRHDSNAKDDPKCVLLIDQLGLEGYGIYWVLVEILREQPEYTYPLALLPSLARRYNTTAEKMKAVVCGYGLFEIRDEKIFFSESLLRRMEEYNLLKAKRKAAGEKGNEARWAGRKQIANASQTDRKRIANASDCDRKPSLYINSNNSPLLSNPSLDKSNSGLSNNEELCPTDEQLDSDNPPFFPETQVPIETKTEVLSNKHCQQVVDFWNRKVKETGAQFPQVKSLSEDRKKKIRIRWEEFKQIGNPVDVCRSLFEKATASKFLQGDNPKGWAATFDWIFTNGKNWLKIYEGNYDEHPVGGSSTKSRINSLKDEFNKIDEIFGGHPNGTEQSDFGIDEQ